MFKYTNFSSIGHVFIKIYMYMQVIACIFVIHKF